MYAYIRRTVLHRYRIQGALASAENDKPRTTGIQTIIYGLSQIIIINVRGLDGRSTLSAAALWANLRSTSCKSLSPAIEIIILGHTPVMNAKCDRNSPAQEEDLAQGSPYLSGVGKSNNLKSTVLPLYNKMDVN